MEEFTCLRISYAQASSERKGFFLAVWAVRRAAHPNTTIKSHLMDWCAATMEDVRPSLISFLQYGSNKNTEHIDTIVVGKQLEH